MEIITKRLMLKEYTADCLKDFFTLKSCKDVWKYSTFVPLTSVNEAEELLTNLITMRAKNEPGFLALYT